MFDNGRLVFTLMCTGYWLIGWCMKRVLMYRSKWEHGRCCRDLVLRFGYKPR